MQLETAPFEIPNAPDNWEEIKKLVEGTEGVVLPLEVVGVDECTEEDEVEPETACDDKEFFKVEVNEPDCVLECFGEYDPKYSCCNDCRKADECHEKTCILGYQEETEDDLGGLAEPEPEWTPPIVRNGKDYKSGEYTSDDELWEIVAKDLVHLRKRAIEVAVIVANRNFDERINQILGGR